MIRYRVIGCLLFLLLSCSKPSPNKITLLLDWLPNPNHIPLFVGDKLGYFQEEGVHLQILKLLDPPSSLPYLRLKQVDVILYYMPYALMAFPQERHLRVIGKLIEKPLDGLLFLQQPLDFSCKTLGVYPGSRISKYLTALFQDKGIAFKEIKQITMDPAVALSTGIVDAIAGVYWNIEPFQLDRMGKESYFMPFSELGLPTYHELLFLTRQDLLEERPFLAPAFRRALQKSLDFCRQNPEKAFSLYAQECRGKSQETLAWEQKAWICTYPLLPCSQDIDRSIFSKFQSWLVSKGLILEENIEILSSYED